MDKKRKKSYYFQARKKGGRLELKAGMRGFFITCNNSEKECVRDAYNLLNEFAANLYGPEKLLQDGSEDQEDVEKQLNSEIQALKQEKPWERRFQSVDTRSRNCIFINTTLEDPGKIVDAITLAIRESNRKCSRYMLRLLPIEATCKPVLEDIRKAADPLLKKYLSPVEGSGDKTFAILFKARNSGAVRRDEVIEELAKLIHVVNPNCKADLNSPDLAVIVEVVCKVCCLGIVKNYFAYQKYNLSAMCGGTDKADGGRSSTLEVEEKGDSVTADGKIGIEETAP